MICSVIVDCAPCAPPRSRSEPGRSRRRAWWRLSTDLCSRGLREAARRSCRAAVHRDLKHVSPPIRPGGIDVIAAARIPTRPTPSNRWSYKTPGCRNRGGCKRGTRGSRPAVRRVGRRGTGQPALAAIGGSVARRPARLPELCRPRGCAAPFEPVTHRPERRSAQKTRPSPASDRQSGRDRRPARRSLPFPAGTVTQSSGRTRRVRHGDPAGGARRAQVPRAPRGDRLRDRFHLAKSSAVLLHTILDASRPGVMELVNRTVRRRESGPCSDGSRQRRSVSAVPSRFSRAVEPLGVAVVV